MSAKHYMRLWLPLLVFILLSWSMVSALDYGCGVYQDQDGNNYNTVFMEDGSGNYRCWFRENLRTTNDSNGIPLAEVIDFRYPNDDPNAPQNYGLLYSRDVIEILCPDGFEVPELQDWYDMVNAQATESCTYPTNNPSLIPINGYNCQNAGLRLSNETFCGGDYPPCDDVDLGATPFNFLPAGYSYHTNPHFVDYEEMAWAWTSTEYPVYDHWYYAVVSPAYDQPNNVDTNSVYFHPLLHTGSGASVVYLPVRCVSEDNYDPNCYEHPYCGSSCGGTGYKSGLGSTCYVDSSCTIPCGCEQDINNICDSECSSDTSDYYLENLDPSTCSIDSSCNELCCPDVSSLSYGTGWDRIWCGANAAGGFTNFISQTSESSLEFHEDWGTNQVGGFQQNNIGFYSAKSLEISSSQDTQVKFTINSDDGYRLWIDGVVEAEDWTAGEKEYELDYNYPAGSHNVRLDYFENTGNANLSFQLDYCGDGVCSDEENCNSCQDDCDVCPYFDPVVITHQVNPSSQSSQIEFLYDNIYPFFPNEEITSLSCIVAPGSQANCVCSDNFEIFPMVSCVFDVGDVGEIFQVNAGIDSAGSYDQINIIFNVTNPSCDSIGDKQTCEQTNGCGWWTGPLPPDPCNSPGGPWLSTPGKCMDCSCTGNSCADECAFPYYNDYFGGGYECDGCFVAANVTLEPETCNGQDDDCNGTIDNITQSCGSAVGECELGSQLCELGSWNDCVGGVDPAPEVCDGLDNDCDHMIDDPFGPPTSLVNCNNCEVTCLNPSWCGGDAYGGDLFEPAGPMQSPLSGRECCGDNSISYENFHDEPVGTLNDACCWNPTDCVATDSDMGVLGGCYLTDVPPEGEGDDYLCINKVWNECTPSNLCEQKKGWTCTSQDGGSTWGWYQNPVEYCVDGIDNDCNGLVDEFCPCELYTFDQGKNLKFKHDGQTIASIDSNGILAISGNLISSIGIPAPRMFSIKDSSGALVSAITEDGDLFVSGNLYEWIHWTGIPGPSPIGQDMIIKKDDNPFVSNNLAVFQEDGDVILNMCLYENAPVSVLD